MIPSNILFANEKIKDIAVIKSQFDKIEKLLKRYCIPYKTLQCHDLEKSEIYNQYRAIFFPCGIVPPIETNVNILSRGTDIKAVYVKEDFSEINKEKIFKNIKSYVLNGGSTYFSGYSFDFLQGAFKPFVFFDNFPNIGMAGKLQVVLMSDLIGFCKEKKLNLYMPHNGWIGIKSITDAEILIKGSYKTPKGLKSGPIVALLKRGGGEIIYTSYHKTGYNKNISRYIIYRISFIHLLNEISEKATTWEQQINSKIIDSILEWEKCRSYYIFLSKGMNTIFFTLEKGLFQIDLFDRKNNLIISKDSNKKNFFLNVNSDSDDYYNLKIYPSFNDGTGAYAVISAKGPRIIPHYTKILYSGISGITLLILFWLKKLIGPKKYSGRIRRSI